MQDINNKLKEILEKLTDFFENFVDEMAEVKTNETTAIFPSADHRTEAGHHDRPVAHHRSKHHKSH